MVSPSPYLPAAPVRPTTLPPLPLPQWAHPLLQPYRYKVLWGGRGAAKSWSVARLLIAMAHTRKLRIGCFREFQNSIKDSVHKLLSDQITEMGLAPYFAVTQNSIISTQTGAEFLFKGLHHNVTEIKSMEGISIAWVEEAQLVSKDSWDLLIPTIRTQGSEIWVTFNPLDEDDETFTRFIKHPPPHSYIAKVNFDANPWFPPTLELERAHMLATDPESYDHVWGGSPRKISDAVIFKNKFRIQECVLPHGVTPRYGVDWGFSNDPLAATRSFITGSVPNEELNIEYEVGGVGVEMEHIAPLLVKGLPGVADGWPIGSDSSRPETISYVRRHGGLNITAAAKWPGSVEDGIAHLKAFKWINIHPRCKETHQNFRLYSYKTDRVTKQVLPLVLDSNNHYPDSVRYALDGFIQARGNDNIWERLGAQ